MQDAKVQNLVVLIQSIVWFFMISDFGTTVFGIYTGLPTSEQPIKMIISFALTIFITAYILCLRFIFEIKILSLRNILIVILGIFVLLDAWTSYEGLHNFIKPVDDDYFGWMLLLVSTFGCISSPVAMAYMKEIEILLEG